MKVLLLTIILGSYNVTAYRSVPEQTDSSPDYTSIGDHTCIHGVAVSQDMLKQNGGPLQYGDWIYIENIGLKQVNDTMAKKMKKHFDIWVSSRKEEHEFFMKFHAKKLKVWRIETHELR